jgi:hypothetical protein
MTNKVTPKSLVLIVGAGASKEVNLPTGAELITKIATLLDFRINNFGTWTGDGGDQVIHNSFARLAKQTEKNNLQALNLEPYYTASRSISDGMPLTKSIDNYINLHQDNKVIAKCAKLAIASCILKAESKSSLYVDVTNSYNELKIKNSESTWFNAFFKLLTECKKSDLNERLSKITIINFNYDRCIEHFLFHALRTSCLFSKEQAAASLANLTIYHPYGTVGKLPWQSQRDGIEFGATPNAEQLITVSEQIQTFTEGIDTSKSDILSIREIVANAKRIAFLGFAFHQLNFELLFPKASESKISKNRHCPTYATAYGISPSDIQHIHTELVNFGGISASQIHIRNDVVCANIFSEYSRGLSLN